MSGKFAMALGDLAAKVFCAGMIVLGASISVANIQTAYSGYTLTSSGQPTEAVIVKKHIDKPNPSSRPKLDSISVNDQKVRTLRTYLYDYLLTVRYSVDGQNVTSVAPVSYNQWQDERVGRTIAITFMPQQQEFVEATDFGLLKHGLKYIGIGLAMALVGLVALRLPASE